MSEATDKRQFLGMEGVKTLLAGLEGEYSPLEHAHDDLIESIEKITDGTTTVAQATEATHSSTSDEATHAESADHATSADSATKATQDAEGNVITDTYETKEDAEAKLEEAKNHANTAIANLVNSAPETLDTLGELATAFEENQEVTDALNAAITNKVEQTTFDEHVADAESRLEALEGTQVDWVQNDEIAKDYVKNRTHYESESVIAEVENIDGLTSVNLSNLGTFYKICDFFEYSTDSNITYDFYKSNGSLYEGTPLISNDKKWVFRNVYSSEEIIAVPTDNYSIFFTTLDMSITIPEAGVYTSTRFKHADYSPEEGFTNTSVEDAYINKIVKKELKQLDEKYIPNTIARVSDVESALSDSSAAVNEQLDSLRTEITEDLEEKVNVFQGTENADTMLTVDEEGYVTLTPIPDEMDAITLLAERGIVEPAITAAGNVYTNKNGDVYTL